MVEHLVSYYQRLFNCFLGSSSSIEEYRYLLRCIFTSQHASLLYSSFMRIYVYILSSIPLFVWYFRWQLLHIGEITLHLSFWDWLVSWAYGLQLGRFGCIWYNFIFFHCIYYPLVFLRNIVQFGYFNVETTFTAIRALAEAWTPGHMITNSDTSMFL